MKNEYQIWRDAKDRKTKLLGAFIFAALLIASIISAPHAIKYCKQLDSERAEKRLNSRVSLASLYEKAFKISPELANKCAEIGHTGSDYKASYSCLREILE